MNIEEKITYEFLLKKRYKSIVFEPDGNIPPDFLVNDRVAVEVRRLNQHFFEMNKPPTGLEKLSYPLRESITETLNSFDNNYQGKTFSTFLEFERPVNLDIYTVKHELRKALENFLKTNQPLPKRLEINENIVITIYPSKATKSKVFKIAGHMDHDQGGWVLSNYINNIQHCIQEKSVKIQEHKQKYKQWILILVDKMGWGLDGHEVNKLISTIKSTGEFDEVLVISQENTLLLTINIEN